MKASSIFLILVGLVIAALGGFFTWLMWGSFQRASDQRTWPQVEAVVLSSEVEEWLHDEFSPREYRLKILYGYEWEGKPKTGERLTVRGSPFSNKREGAEEFVDKYPTGKKITVFVNPADHDSSIIEPDSKAAGYSIWFPLLFVVGGLGIAGRVVVRILPRKSAH